VTLPKEPDSTATMAGACSASLHCEALNASTATRPSPFLGRATISQRSDDWHCSRCFCCCRSKCDISDRLRPKGESAAAKSRKYTA